NLLPVLSRHAEDQVRAIDVPPREPSRDVARDVRAALVRGLDGLRRGGRTVPARDAGRDDLGRIVAEPPPELVTQDPFGDRRTTDVARADDEDAGHGLFRSLASASSVPEHIRAAGRLRQSSSATSSARSPSRKIRRPATSTTVEARPAI